MQAIMETLFDIAYLTTVITLGVKMAKGAGKNDLLKLFGIMAIILGCGDAFHLVPRSYALWTTGLEANAAALGFGKLVTSVTMTVFYVILYHIWQKRYKVNNKALTITMYSLAALRVILCAFPQNQWLSATPPVSWGILRNIPFALMGLLVIVLFFQKAKETSDSRFKNMWLAVTLSFAFYVPVVLWSDAFPLVGTLMIPKTCAYVWIVWMGYSEYVALNKQAQEAA